MPRLPPNSRPSPPSLALVSTALSSLAAAMLLVACQSSAPRPSATRAGEPRAAAPAPQAAADAPLPATVPTTPAGQRELDREEAELRLALGDNRVEITRGDERLSLRMPAQLLFAADAVAIKTDAAALAPLTNLAALLRKHAATHVEVVVHTDSIGGAAANQGLAQQRADAVATALQAAGLDRARVHATGAGAAQPLAVNDTPEGRMSNRRVELVLQDASKA